MAKELKLGIIGMSEGNGHPYSWAAIFNGYNKELMSKCPFSVIPEYLGKQNFPEDSIKNAKVTHIWTQDDSISESISKSSLIPNICNNLEDMIGEVDAVLLARDDAENHFNMAHPFIKAGLPIFIDKPLAYNIGEANKILSEQQYDNQVFTCSSLRFAQEFNPSILKSEKLGQIVHIAAQIPKSWEKYAVHIIEPSLNMFSELKKIESVESLKSKGINVTNVCWEDGTTAVFKTFGNYTTPLSITVFCENGYKEYLFKDTFNAFKSSLQYFIDLIQGKRKNISREQTLQVIEIIERGM
jgi:predicted dehydrogenase